MVKINSKNQAKSIGRLSLSLLKSYFRMEVEGVENIPASGRGLIVPNHSGFMGVDALLLASTIKRETKRRPRILAHRAYFDYSKTLKNFSESRGLKRASLKGGVETLNRGQLLLIFPEGEAGNFKPSIQRYKLQPFRGGFLRMALQTRSPIVPCLIVGAEESHLNLGNLDLTGLLKNVRIPMPMNFVPLPAKWKIIFLPPISPDSFVPEVLEDKVLLQREGAKIQKRMQKELDRQRKKRKYIYSPQARSLLNRVGKSFRKALSP